MWYPWTYDNIDKAPSPSRVDIPSCVDQAVSYSNWILYSPGGIGNYGHLDYVMPGDRKTYIWKKNTYNSLEI